MNEYHKIKTVWERDPETKFRTLIEGAWAIPEFGYLANMPWEWTEKVDGTNIRIDTMEDDWRIGGRTDRAQIPAFLLERLQQIASEASKVAPGLTLYGEGYGARIQKAGGNYKPDGVDFVLFDVQCGDLWLERANVEDIADKIGVRAVPVIGEGTLDNAIMFARGGFNSRWGDFDAEGLVMRPKVELQTRRGERLITKIKAKDFVRQSVAAE